MKLDFVVPGFSKCGTTSLCAMLAEHPEIGIPLSHKEIGFFSNYFDLGWAWYEPHFYKIGNKRFVGEGSTNYSTAEHSPWVAARLAVDFPDIRLIFIARNPFARLESIYRELHHSGHYFGIRAPYDIDRALRTIPSMVEDTRYWQNINAYRRHFPDTNILVLFLEDLEREPAAELARCFEFLGADPTVQIEDLDRRLNVGSSKQRDSRLLRFLKSNLLTRGVWNCLARKDQEWLVRKLHLRQRFREPIEWSSATRTWVLDKIYEDSQKFLEFYGKPIDFWDLARSLSESLQCDRATA